MEWLTPWVGAITAGAAAPALLLLYFLKLRRQEVPVSSTLLWKRAVQDLQVNAPFQRLRKNLLLLLQLLAMAAVLFALAQPVLNLRGGSARRIVLLVDRSASMKTRDLPGGVTRLDEAKKQARTVVESMRSARMLGLVGRGDEAMVLAFDSHAAVMCNFTSNKAQLLAAIDAIAPTDGASRLGEAVTVARAFANPAREDAPAPGDFDAAQLVLLSDGRVADLAALSVAPGEVDFHLIGESSDNVAITAMQARRSYEKPEQVHVFATLANYGAKAVACDVQLTVAGVVRAVRQVEIEAAAASNEDRVVGRASITFELDHSGAGVVEVRQLRKDLLAADDAAWAVLPAPRKLTALLVTRGNAPLEVALKACSLARLDVAGPEAFDAVVADDAPAPPYDVIVLDRHAPAKLPRGRYLIFGEPPPDIGVTNAGLLKDQFVIDWRSRHPVMQFVDLGDLYAAEAVDLRLPRDAAVLAEFGQSPAMAMVRRKGSALLLVGFDVLATRWPLESGFVMFCYNAVHFMGAEAGRGRAADMTVGEAIDIPSDGAPLATLTRPDGKTEPLTAGASGAFRYPATDTAGVYRVDVAGRPPALLAVNLLDERESDIAPSDQLMLAGGKVNAAANEPSRTNQDVWPYLALLALVLVCAEWIVYNSKARL